MRLALIAAITAAWVAFCLWIGGYSLYLQYTYCPAGSIVRDLHCYQQVK